MLGEPDIEGATAVIINGLRNMVKQINSVRTIFLQRTR